MTIKTWPLLIQSLDTFSQPCFDVPFYRTMQEGQV